MAVKTKRWEPLQHELVRRARIPSKARVLDVGTGTGVSALDASAAAGPSGLVVACDNAEALVRAAKREAVRRALKNLRFGIIDMSRLPFPDNTFHHVISSFAIYGSYPPGVGLSEAYRVLRGGGSLAFSMFGQMTEGAEAMVAVEKVFEQHRPMNTSELLRVLPEAFSLVPLGFCPAGPLAEPADASQVMEFVRSLGFEDVEALVACSRAVSETLERAIDFLIGGRLDYLDMSEDEKRSTRRSCFAAVEPLLTDEGYVVSQQVVYVTAKKAA